MKVGDLVKTDPWLPECGKIGIVIDLQNIIYCKGAYVFFKETGIKLFRIENLEVISESW